MPFSDTTRKGAVTLQVLCPTAPTPDVVIPEGQGEQAMPVGRAPGDVVSGGWGGGDEVDPAHRSPRTRPTILVADENGSG